MDDHALLEMLGLVLALIQDIEKIASQQLSGFSALLKFIPLIPKIAPALRDIGLIVPEYEALSDDQRASLKAYVEANFQLVDANAEAVIKQVLGIVIDLSQLVQALQASPVVHPVVKV